MRSAQGPPAMIAGFDELRDDLGTAISPGHFFHRGIRFLMAAFVGVDFEIPSEC